MAQFADYLSTVGANEDGSVMYPEGFIDGAQGAYDADMQGATATIALLQAQIDELTAQNMQLAAANWTLLQSTPTNGATDDAPADDAPDEEGDGDGEDDVNPDDWFDDSDK